MFSVKFHWRTSGSFWVGTGGWMDQSARDPLHCWLILYYWLKECIITLNILLSCRFFCELCQVAATSQDQLDMHFNGAKHKKAEKAAGGTTPAGMWKVPTTVAVPIPPPGIFLKLLCRLSDFSVIKLCSRMVFYNLWHFGMLWNPRCSSEEHWIQASRLTFVVHLKSHPW